MSALFLDQPFTCEQFYQFSTKKDLSEQKIFFEFSVCTTCAIPHLVVYFSLILVKFGIECDFTLRVKLKSNLFPFRKIP
ncbi:hypothetical protein BpHYR1_044912 [Brachionus plicatilis]|uniref:Uncharacterized protein n=1 Tax=Brachionus plicatilis TaxID=10195 RepID=A0A3M7R7I9_BRAPC|nr:hypothetical protein BpHYR1_044912 [Brachionus plicatilis]